jgi:hypothetical protein
MPNSTPCPSTGRTQTLASSSLYMFFARKSAFERGLQTCAVGRMTISLTSTSAGAALARSACQFLAASLGTASLPRRRPALTTALDGRSSKPPDRPAANPCKSATLVSHDTLCAAR